MDQLGKDLPDMQNVDGTVEQSEVSFLDFATTGGMGKEAITFYRRLGELVKPGGERERESAW